MSLCPTLNLPRLPIDNEQPLQSVDIEQAAAQVRDHWNVPRGPINDVVRLLEMNGIVAVRFRVSIEKVDAFCVDFPDRPVVALGADKGLRDRSRFDAVHELVRAAFLGKRSCLVLSRGGRNRS